MKIKVFLVGSSVGDSESSDESRKSEIGESDLLIHFLQYCHLVLLDSF